MTTTKTMMEFPGVYSGQAGVHLPSPLGPHRLEAQHPALQQHHVYGALYVNPLGLGGAIPAPTMLGLVIARDTCPDTWACAALERLKGVPPEGEVVGPSIASKLKQRVTRGLLLGELPLLRERKVEVVEGR